MENRVVTTLFCESTSRSSDDLLIASTNTSAGKNLLTCGMLRAARKRGVRLKPFKPLEIDNFDMVTTTLSPGMYQKAQSAGVPVEGHMCPIWIVYNWNISISDPDLYLRGVRKGRISDYSLDQNAVRSVIEESVSELKKDGSRLIIEAPGAFSESYSSPAVKAVLETLCPDIILVGDFLRGGGLAFLIGTLELLPQEIRGKIVGIVFNHLDESQGVEYPVYCRTQLKERFGIGIIGMLPTWREGFDTISEDNKIIPEPNLFDAQVDRLAIEMESRIHPSIMDKL